MLFEQKGARNEKRKHLWRQILGNLTKKGKHVKWDIYWGRTNGDYNNILLFGLVWFGLGD
jgi:hypothetical protein